MARGWESKSVEEQQAEAASAPAQVRLSLTPTQLVVQRQKQGLILSRHHVLEQLDHAQNPRYREMLQSALADLDRRLSQLQEPPHDKGSHTS